MLKKLNFGFLLGAIFFGHSDSARSLSEINQAPRAVLVHAQGFPIDTQLLGPASGLLVFDMGADLLRRRYKINRNKEVESKELF